MVWAVPVVVQVLLPQMVPMELPIEATVVKVANQILLIQPKVATVVRA
jgi:hypothetical protein